MYHVANPLHLWTTTSFMDHEYVGFEFFFNDCFKNKGNVFFGFYFKTNIFPSWILFFRMLQLKKAQVVMFSLMKFLTKHLFLVIGNHGEACIFVRILGKKNSQVLLEKNGFSSVCSFRCCSASLSLLLSRSYAALIADWPVVVLGMCTVLIVVCALVGILVPDLPDFSDPLLVSQYQSVVLSNKYFLFAVFSSATIKQQMQVQPLIQY